MSKIILSLSVITAVFASSFCLTGCGGGSSRNTAVQETRTTTAGQELLDLQKAYEAGVITEREYQAQKKKILSK